MSSVIRRILVFLFLWRRSRGEVRHFVRHFARRFERRARRWSHRSLVAFRRTNIRTEWKIGIPSGVLGVAGRQLFQDSVGDLLSLAESRQVVLKFAIDFQR